MTYHPQILVKSSYPCYLLLRKSNVIWPSFYLINPPPPLIFSSIYPHVPYHLNYYHLLPNPPLTSSLPFPYVLYYYSYYSYYCSYTSFYLLLLICMCILVLIRIVPNFFLFVPFFTFTFAFPAFYFPVVSSALELAFVITLYFYDFSSASLFEIFYFLNPILLSSYLSAFHFTFASSILSLAYAFHLESSSIDFLVASSSTLSFILKYVLLKLSGFISISFCFLAIYSIV